MNFLELVAKLKLESPRQGPAPASPATSTKDDLRLWSWVADEWVTLQTCGVLWKFMRQPGTLALTVGNAVYPGTSLLAGGITRFWPLEPGVYASMARADGSTYQMQRELEYGAFLRAVCGGLAPGLPSFYALNPGGGISVAPAPIENMVMSVDVVAAPQTLAGVTDVPLGLPAHHHSIIVWGALKRLAVKDANVELLGRANFEYDEAWIRLFLEQGPEIEMMRGLVR